MKDFSVIILVDKAGEGMKSSLPSAHHKICGKKVFEYTADVVVGGQIVLVGENEIDGWVCVRTAEECSAAVNAECAVVLTGKCFLYDSGAIEKILSFYEKSEKKIIRVSDSEGADTGIYVCDADSIEVVLSGNVKDSTEYKASDESGFFRAENRVQLMEAEKLMQKRINEKLMLSGVTIHASETVIISPDAVIGEDTEIYPNVVIEGKTVIGSGVTVGSTSKIVNSVIGDGVDIQSSVILDSSISDNTTVGPFAYVRPGCVVGSNVRVGDFVELKNANVGNGTKISHLTYVGDADVGEKCNFGCGTVTVNYDGKKKYRTTIGNNVFIGCNSNLVAPVTLKDGAYTAAGSTITDEVPENTLAIARARQINKAVWKDRRK